MYSTKKNKKNNNPNENIKLKESIKMNDPKMKKAYSLILPERFKFKNEKKKKKKNNFKKK